MLQKEDYLRCKHCLRGSVVKMPEDDYSYVHWMCTECFSTYDISRYPVASEEAARLVEHLKDKEDAEKYRALQAGLAAGHREVLGKDCGVWDSRNISQ